MEFDSYSNVSDYVKHLRVENLIQVDMIIGIPRWSGANNVNYDYYTITKITDKFVMLKHLGIAKKNVGSELGGYQQVQFRLYKQRDGKVKNNGEKPKTKISINKLSTHNLIIKKQNKKYGFISLNETYGGQEDWGH